MMVFSTVLGALLAVAVIPAATNEYYYTTGAAPYSIVGEITTNGVPRGENYAWLFEAAFERQDLSGTIDNCGLGEPPLQGASYPGYCYPFPPLVPDYDYNPATNAVASAHGLRWLVAARSYGNSAMTTQSLDNAALRWDAERSSISGIVPLGPAASNTAETVYARLFRPGVRPWSRRFDYFQNPSDSNYNHSVAMQSSTIEALFRDFVENDALAFTQTAMTPTNRIARTTSDLTYHDTGSYGIRGGTSTPSWSVDPTNIVHTEHTSVSVYANGPLAFQPEYFEQYAVQRQTSFGINMSNIVSRAEGWRFEGFEFQDEPGDLLIWFEPAFSNRIAAIEAYALYSLVTRENINTNGYATGERVLRNDWFLAPVSTTSYSSGENGGPRWQIVLQWPAAAHAVVLQAGETYPGAMSEQIKAMVPAPDEPAAPPPGYDDPTRYDTVSSRYNSAHRVLWVKLEAIVGLAKMVYRARLRDN